MKEKSFAIFLNRDLRKNAGGPSGYLFNLISGLEDNGISIDVYTNKPRVINRREKKNDKRTLLALVYADARLAASLLFKGKKLKESIGKDIKNKEAIHVHASEDLFALRSMLGYRGKILFTPHRPETLADEIVTAQQLSNGTEFSFPILTIVCRYLEKYSYKHADAFIFPSEHARAIYEAFPGFQKYSHNKIVKYVYTGAPDRMQELDENDYRETIKIKEQDDIVAYIGRHNYIKGYDLLVDAYQQIKKDNCVVVCAGATSSIVYPDDSGWIELGYINDALRLMRDASVVVIPNRNTYFDLVIIEALSAGAIVVTSDTGGNIDISKETKGLQLFKSGDMSSLVCAIERVLNMSIEERKEYRSMNRKIYEEKCSINRFAYNYWKAVNEICDSLSK